MLNPSPIPHLIPFVHGTIRPGTGNINRPQNFHSEKDKDNQNKQSMGEKEKKDVKQQLRAMMGGQVLCQLCYGWQTLKCLIQSGGRGAGGIRHQYSVVTSPCLNHGRKVMWL